MQMRTTAILMLSSVLTGAAIAQTSPTMPSGAPATMGATGSGTTSGMSDKFVTEQMTGQYRASKFVGLSVYGADNTRIGDINEVLIDAQGNAKALVIGVGGFLGLGEKNVGVPFSSVEWVNAPVAAANTAATAPATQPGTIVTSGGTSGMTTNPSTSPATGGTATTTMSTTSGTATGAGGTAATGAMPMTAGRVATGTGGTMPGPNAAANRSPAERAAYNGYPDHAVLRMTKDELQNAPTFRYVSDTPAPTGAPRQ